MATFFTGRPTVVVHLIITFSTFFFLVFLSYSASSPQQRSIPHIFERRQVLVTSQVTRLTTVFAAKSTTVTLELEFGPSSLPASSAPSSVPPLSTSTSHSSIPASSSTSLDAGSSTFSSTRTTRSTTACVIVSSPVCKFFCDANFGWCSRQTLTSTIKKSTTPSLTSIQRATPSRTLILVPTTLSIPTPSTTFLLTGDVFSPSTLVVANTATSSDETVPSSPPSVPVQASNSRYVTNLCPSL